MSSSVCGSRLRTTTAATSRSTRRPLPAARSAGGSTWASPTAAAAATRWPSPRTWRRRSARSSGSIRSARTASNGKYGVPADNPFVKRAGALPEIYALGVRNPQRLLGPEDAAGCIIADIGQNIVEEISPVTAGANLGWNVWEGNYRLISREAVSLEKPRSDSAMTYPVAEWGQPDPLLQSSGAQRASSCTGDADSPTCQSLDLRGHAERRDFSRQRGRTSAGRRTGSDSPHPAQRRGKTCCRSSRRRTRRKARNRRPDPTCAWRKRRRPCVPAEQGGRRDSGAGPVTSLK